MKPGWETVPMGQLCSIKNGKSDTQDAVDDGAYAFFDRSRTVKRSSRYLYDCEALIIPGEGTEFLPRHFAGKFDLHQRAYALFKFSKLVNVRYLYYFLHHVADYFPRVAVGATVKSLRMRHFEQLPVSLTSIPEQQRIVGILDAAVEAIATAKANAERNLANARALFDASFAALAPESEQERWPKATVAEIAAPRKGSIRTGPFGSQLLHGEFVDRGIAVLGIDNVVTNEFRWGQRRYITPAKYQQLQRYRVHTGDVLISIMGTCGRCAVVPGDIPTAINTKHLCCITLDEGKCRPGYLHAYFLHHPLAQDYLNRRAKGAIMAGLNMEIIKELPVLLPRPERQGEIVSKLMDLGETTQHLASVYEQKLAALDELRKSLLHQAFSGEL